MGENKVTKRQQENLNFSDCLNPAAPQVARNTSPPLTGQPEAPAAQTTASPDGPKGSPVQMLNVSQLSCVDQGDGEEQEKIYNK